MGSNVRSLVILLILSRYLSAIELSIPLTNEAAENFNVTKKYLHPSVMPQSVNALYDFCCYEAVEGLLITRVVYHGVELLNDPSEHAEGFRRLVYYEKFNSRIVLSIYSNHGEVEMERAFYLDNIRENNAVLGVPVLTYYMHNMEQNELPRAIMNILTRVLEKKEVDFGELDQVDDEPFLMRSEHKISLKELETEIDETILNLRPNKDEIEAPGPSGLQAESVGWQSKPNPVPFTSDSDSD